MIKVRVPATSANIGPGFDCLGLALNLYNNFYFEEIEGDIFIEGCEKEFANKDNLVYTSMEKTLNKIGYDLKGVRIKIESNIPISRGLGSSASCIIGGVLGANELAGGILNKKQILEIATEIEGHPDNVAPALLGGITVAISSGENILYSKIKTPKDISFYGFIPDFRLSTKEAREVLPKDIPYTHGVYNVGRVSLLVSALFNGEYGLLKEACKDKLHEPYRSKLIPQYDEIVSKCEELGSLGVFLSGAGPTIMAMVHRDNIDFYDKIKKHTERLEYAVDIKKLYIDQEGATVYKE